MSPPEKWKFFHPPNYISARIDLKRSYFFFPLKLAVGTFSGVAEEFRDELLRRNGKNLEGPPPSLI